MSALYNGGKLTGVVGVFWRGYKKTLDFITNRQKVGGEID
jgi:hypothetical protein